MMARSFEEWYLLLSPGISSFLVSKLRDQDLAEDVMQQTFLKAWLHWREWTPEQRATVNQSWFYQIANHLAIDVLRRSKIRVTCPLDFDLVSENERDPQSVVPQHLEVQQVLSQINPRYRLLLRCWMFGYTSEEMTSALSCSSHSLTNHLYRAKESFKRSYLGMVQKEVKGVNNQIKEDMPVTTQYCAVTD